MPLSAFFQVSPADAVGKQALARFQVHVAAEHYCAKVLTSDASPEEQARKLSDTEAEHKLVSDMMLDQQARIAKWKEEVLEDLKRAASQRIAAEQDRRTWLRECEEHARRAFGSKIAMITA